VNGKLVAPMVLPPAKEAPDTNWIRGWVGPRTGLDAMEKRTFCPARNRNPAVQSVYMIRTSSM
jgi:hypothetical protein